jgi:serine/threonine protein kinase
LPTIPARTLLYRAVRKIRHLVAGVPAVHPGASHRVVGNSVLDRLVVVKSIKSGVDPKRILDELSALQSIRSKHVVQIYDVIWDDDGTVQAIVEEYLLVQI